MANENNLPSVTVIIAAYNAEAYLSVAVDSVLKQTEQNFEIIIVDDCSQDGTFRIAQSYAAVDKRIRAVRMPQNGGQYIAINHAINLAMGKWITALDSDDRFHPDRLKVLTQEAEKRGVNIVADTLHFYDNSAKVYYYHNPPPDKAHLIDRKSFMARSNPLIYNRSDYGTLKPVFRTAALKKHSLKYLEKKNGADYYFLLAWLLRGEKILLLPHSYYIYVEPVGVLSRKFSHPARKPYSFLNFNATNDTFLSQYGAELTKGESSALHKRGRFFIELDRSERLRQLWLSGKHKEALSVWLESPFVVPVVILIRGIHLYRLTRTRRRAQSHSTLHDSLTLPQSHESAEKEAGHPSIGVVIATKGRSECIPHVIKTLERQTVAPKIVIFSIVEKTDLPADFEALSTAAKLNIVMVSGLAGLTCQRNAGIKHIKDQTDIILFIDDDFYLAPNWLECCAALFASNPAIVGATGAIIADGMVTGSISWGEAEKLINNAPQKKTAQANHARIPSTYGCNMAFRTAALVGETFDERLVLYAWLEDADFSRRIGKKGRLVKSDALQGVHLGFRGGRISGTKYGYSQVVNPYYLWRKGTLPGHTTLVAILKPLLMNIAKSLKPEQHIDRRGRLRGNLIGLYEVARGRQRPERALSL